MRVIVSNDMRTKFCLVYVLMCIILCSCSSNEYKFYESTTAILSVYDNPYGRKDYKVAVDVYAKDGEYDHYKIKNKDGVEYDASRATAYPSEFKTWTGDAPFCVYNFRQGNVVGTLYLPF